MTKQTIDIIISTLNQEIRILKENNEVESIIDDVVDYLDGGHTEEAIKAIEDYRIESKHIKEVEKARDEFMSLVEGQPSAFLNLPF